MITNTIKKLSDTIRRKFVEILDASFIQIQSDQGWTDVKTMNKTVEYQVYRIHFASGRLLECADTHIIIDKDYNEVFAKDSLGCEILTTDGTDIVTDVEVTDRYENMYDFELSENSNHLYYSNGVLSHNTTLMTIYALWLANFFPDQNIIICGDKALTASMIFEKIRLAYLELPNWLKCPVVDFNARGMKLHNGSKIVTSPTTDSAIRGNTVSCLILDEFAFVEPGIADKFWASVTPTLVTNPNAKLFISSTPNGVGNMFWQLYDNAINARSNFKVRTVTWADVPGRDEAWKQNIIKTEMNGDVEKFEQEYECKFLGASASPFSDKLFERIKKDLRQPKAVLDDNHLYVWEYPKNQRVYSIGVDVGEGLGIDRSVIQVFDMTDLSNIDQVACWSADDIGVTEFAQKVYEVANMYGAPALSVERNGCGTEVCSRLYNDLCYQYFVNHGSSGKSFRPGIISGQNTKGPAVTNWKHYIADAGVVHIHDERYLEELNHFENDPSTNKWAARRGYHDDYIMSSVWALNVLHRDLVNKVFDVIDYNVDGTPKIIKSKFDYNVDITEDFVSYNYQSYRVPVAVFGQATSTAVIDASNFKFVDEEDKRVWSCFDEEAWERLPDWASVSKY